MFDVIVIGAGPSGSTAAKLHNYMKRQWSFIAGIADTFKEMKL